MKTFSLCWKIHPHCYMQGIKLSSNLCFLQLVPHQFSCLHASQDIFDNKCMWLDNPEETHAHSAIQCQAHLQPSSKFKRWFRMLKMQQRERNIGFHWAGGLHYFSTGCLLPLLVFLLWLNKDWPLMVILGISFFLNPGGTRKERVNRPSSFSIIKNIVLNIVQEATWYLRIILIKLNCNLR